MNNTVTIEIVDSAALRFLRDLAAISLIRFTQEIAVEEENITDSDFGRLNAYANPSLVSEESNAWAYQAMAADTEREQEAQEWCNAYFGPTHK